MPLSFCGHLPVVCECRWLYNLTNVFRPLHEYRNTMCPTNWSYPWVISWPSIKPIYHTLSYTNREISKQNQNKTTKQKERQSQQNKHSNFNILIYDGVLACSVTLLLLRNEREGKEDSLVFLNHLFSTVIVNI